LNGDQASIMPGPFLLDMKIQKILCGPAPLREKKIPRAEALSRREKINKVFIFTLHCPSPCITVTSHF